MSVAIKLTCNHVEDGAGCRSTMTRGLELNGDDGLLADGDQFTIDIGWWPLPRGWTVHPDGRVYCDLHAEGRRHDCEAALKAHPLYSITRETPVIFACACGLVYAARSEEADGLDWVSLGRRTTSPCHGMKDAEAGYADFHWGEDRCEAPAILVEESPGGTDTYLCERGHRVAIGK